MARFIRYALATVCFAASVGCLALWQRSDKLLAVTYLGINFEFEVAADFGFASVYINEGSPSRQSTWALTEFDAWETPWFADELVEQGRFGGDGNAIYFPLWYASLVFTLTGVAALRFRRQFSIRSALAVVSVVAALLGMVVAL
jgi:hypothetical protein